MANTQKTIDDAQLKSILSEVTSELDVMMKSEMEKLAKARPGESTPDEGESDKSKTDPSGDNTSAASASPDPASASPDAAGSDSAPPAPDASASAPPADASAAPPADGSAPGGDPAAQAGPIDPQQLMAEYTKLSPEDLKLHYLACKEALVQVLGAAGGDPSASAPPAGPSAPPAAASAPPPPPAASAPPAPDASGPTIKAEIPAGKEMPSDKKAIGENPLHKAEIDGLKTQLAQQETVMSTLVKAVKTVLEAPLRKSITSVADITVPAKIDVTALSRAEIRAKLNTVAQSTTLSKSDRDLIVGFDVGTVKADKVAHLLVPATK